jgi:predicted CopG family antitoxin
MPNLTLSIPEELHEKMKKHSEIRWSEVVRKTISGKVELLEVMDKIASKSKLTKKDVEDISHKVNRDVFNELNKR